MDNFNIDENSINKLKDMLNKGELNDVISKIPPEMMQNFSSMMGGSNNNSNSNSGNGQNANTQSNFNNTNNNVANNNASASNNASNGFDFSNIDMNTILKMKSVMDKMNNSNDPRSNLLYSLKPYLRDSKKEKLDQYANLLNVAKIAELFKNDGKENGK